MKVRKAIVLTIAAGVVMAGTMSSKTCAQADDHNFAGNSDPLFDRPMIWAQQEPGVPMMGPGRLRSQQLRKEMESGPKRKHIEQLRMLKLLEVLDLNEKQEPEFLVAFRGMRKTMRELDDRKGATIEKLSVELKSSKPNDRKIDNFVDSVLNIESTKRQAMESFIESSRRILTPVQVGRLLVFNEKFEYELLERVREFRERMRNDSSIPRDEGDGR